MTKQTQREMTWSVQIQYIKYNETRFIFSHGMYFQQNKFTNILSFLKPFQDISLLKYKRTQSLIKHHQLSLISMVLKIGFVLFFRTVHMIHSLRVVCDFRSVSYSKDLIIWLGRVRRVMKGWKYVKQQATENNTTAWKQQKYWNTMNHLWQHFVVSLMNRAQI